MNDVQIGDTFGAWTVIAAAPAHPFRGTARWKVQCGGCAATCVREENQLKAGRTQQCNACRLKAHRSHKSRLGAAASHAKQRTKGAS